jgi:hypothetical protein
MLKQVLAGALVIGLGAVGTSFAGPRDPGGLREFALEPRDPGGTHEFDQGRTFTESKAPGSRVASQALLTEIAAWLAAKFDMPAIQEYPRIEFAPPLKIAAMRYKSMLPLAWREDSIPDPATQTVGLREVIAVYRDDQRTIYLNERWTGATPGEVSVLVHEMVHHIQNVARLKYDCPAAREKPAYLAQNDWLKRFGSDLETEFDIDMMTMLVTTSCMN